MGVGGWGWLKAQGQVTGGVPQHLWGSQKGSREFGIPPCWLSFALTIPLYALQALCPGGSGGCEVLSLGGVRANSCKILCAKNSSASGQFQAAWSVWGPDLELGFKSLKINLLFPLFLPGV